MPVQPVIPDESKQVAPLGFGETLWGSTMIDDPTKQSIQDLYSGLAKAPDRNAAITQLNQSIYGSGLDQATKDALSKMTPYEQAAARQRQRRVSGGGGGGGTGGGGGGTGGGQSYITDYLKGALSGDFSNLPMYAEMTDPK